MSKRDDGIKVMPVQEEVRELATSEEFVRSSGVRIRGGVLVAYGIGELTRTDKQVRGTHGHAVPQGCQWARDCEECPWPDCVIPSTSKQIDYNSEEARRLRAEFATRTHIDEGKTIEETAALLYVSPSSVKRGVNAVRGPAQIVKRERDKNIVRLRKEGKTLWAIATLLSISYRTTQRVVKESFIGIQNTGGKVKVLYRIQ